MVVKYLAQLWNVRWNDNVFTVSGYNAHNIVVNSATVALDLKLSPLQIVCVICFTLVPLVRIQLWVYFVPKCAQFYECWTVYLLRMLSDAKHELFDYQDMKR